MSRFYILGLSFLLLLGCANVPSSFDKQNANNVLIVNVQKGKIDNAGSLVDIQPVTLTLKNYTCQQVQLLADQGKLNRTLQACYFGNSLYFDPKKLGRGQTVGSIRFNAIPLWQQGFIYRNINSSGPGSLVNADIRIQIQTQ